MVTSMFYMHTSPASHHATVIEITGIDTCPSCPEPREPLVSPCSPKGPGTIGLPLSPRPQTNSGLPVLFSVAHMAMYTPSPKTLSIKVHTFILIRQSFWTQLFKLSCTPPSVWRYHYVEPTNSFLPPSTRQLILTYSP